MGKGKKALSEIAWALAYITIGAISIAGCFAWLLILWAAFTGRETG